jgi:hypothetical protein
VQNDADEEHKANLVIVQEGGKTAGWLPVTG